MSEGDAEMLRHASAMHDVGKIGIPDRVLLKPGRLDEAEWEIMRTHPKIGAEILAGSRWPVVQMGETIALAHHERWDGSGYPAGLAGEDIPLVARIVAICDVFDALLSERPYKQPWPVADALAEIRSQAGRHFDPRLVELFLGIAEDLHAEIGYGTPARAPEPAATEPVPLAQPIAR
jgi:putative two-component system response regulator